MPVHLHVRSICDVDVYGISSERKCKQNVQGCLTTLLNRLYGGFLFMNTCTAVYEDHRK